MAFHIISGKEAEKFVGQLLYVFVDLRERKAYDSGHIRGAISLPYEYFYINFQKLSQNRVYVLYCNYGSISMLAGRRMDEAGYDVLSISGGISSYRGHLFV